ncbi:hypothetical protein HPB48_011791 [Haemaphysalis longicornis]|uniref:Transposable element P transposase-like RNase H domain-containing protein n=1 Tax=Haemaphysalis longicornis TaxID=44386 RepID=A0A9J6G6Z4_HAELO|nr:hypothetical protein HPB48_011791 [Haemaphysalis longicornis]
MPLKCQKCENLFSVPYASPAHGLFHRSRSFQKSSSTQSEHVLRHTFNASYGFSHKLEEKASEMDETNRHGGLVIDEMKLSTHLDLKSTTDIEGSVNLGQFTGAKDKHTKADHGLVVMFQPFVRKWTQVIGVFASNRNVKAPTLTKDNF